MFHKRYSFLLRSVIFKLFFPYKCLKFWYQNRWRLYSYPFRSKQRTSNKKITIFTFIKQYKTATLYSQNVYAYKRGEPWQKKAERWNILKGLFKYAEIQYSTKFTCLVKTFALEVWWNCETKVFFTLFFWKSFMKHVHNPEYILEAHWQIICNFKCFLL